MTVSACYNDKLIDFILVFASLGARHEVQLHTAQGIGTESIYTALG